MIYYVADATDFQGQDAAAFFAPGRMSGFLKQNHFRSRKFCDFGTEEYRSRKFCVSGTEPMEANKKDRREL